MARLPSTLNRALCIVRRWIDLAIYAIPASALYAYAPDLSSVAFKRIAATLWHEPPLVAAGVCVAIGLTVAAIAHALTKTRFGHLHALFTYPPLPLIVSTSILASALWPTQPPSAHPFPAHLVAAAYFLLWFLQVALREAFAWPERIRHSRHNETPTMARRHLHDFSDGELAAWLEREEPIGNHAQDLFDFTPIAERILNRLSLGDTTIALHAPFGAGKSSTLRLAQALAQKRRSRLQFLFVSCWGFDDSARAQEAVLEEIIDFANTRVDCFPVRRIPRDYAATISGTHPWLPVLGPFLHRSGSPLAQLRRLSPILSAAGCKLVIVIEDVDRNGSQFDLSHIQALLSRFRDVPNLSFVLAVSQGQDFEFARFTEFLEPLSPLPRETVSAILNRVRSIGIGKHDTILVDKLEPLTFDDDDTSLRRLPTSDSTLYWPISITRLLSTPRALKAVLRRMLHAWEELHGEVNIDDLLTVITLHTIAPNALSFLIDEFERLSAVIKEQRGAFERPDDREERIKRFRSAWNVRARSLPVDRIAVEALLADLLPGSSSVFGVKSYSQDKVQGLASKRGHIYARRLFREALDPGEPRDQIILTKMQAADRNEAAMPALAEEILESHAASAAFEHFDRLFDRLDLYRLLSEVYALIRRRFGPRLDRENLPGFFSPWRLLIDRRREDGFQRWLESELVLCVPRHLHLLTQIYYYWLGTPRHSRNEREPFRRRILEECKNAFPGLAPRAFADCFNPAFPYILFHLVFTADYEHPDHVPYGSIADWAWLGPILLDAARAAPNELLPQIIIACNSVESRGGDIPRFAFDETTMTAWFPDSRSELLQIISRHLQIDPALNPHAQAILRLAIEAAQSEMKKNPLP